MQPFPPPSPPSSGEPATVSATVRTWQALHLPGRGRTWCYDSGPRPSGTPTVVLLHGWAIAGATTWSPTIDRLADRYRVIALDHRGHGQGIDDDGTFTLEACADDVAALLAVLGVEHTVVVGFSMGGPIAQLVWRRHPAMVDGLVMVATAADFGSSMIARIGMQAVEGVGTPLRLLPAWLRRRGARTALWWFVADPEARAALAHEFAANRDTVLLAALRELRSFRSAAWLSQVDVPTAVVVTERDRVVAPEEQRRLVAALPEPLVVHMDQDHLCFVTEPEVFAAAVEAAVADVAARAVAGRRARVPGRRRLRAWWRRWRAVRRARRTARREDRTGRRSLRGEPSRHEGDARSLQ